MAVKKKKKKKKAGGVSSKKRPSIPQPSPEKVKHGAPDSRASYIEEGVPRYRHKSGTKANRLKLLAWKDGEHFAFYLSVHRDVGVGGGSYTCLSKVWNEPCPICEDIRDQLKGGATNDQIKNQGLWAKTRLLINCIDRKAEEKGVLLVDFPKHKIDKALTSISLDEVTGGVLPVTHPEEGFDLIYDYDAEAQYPMPENLTLSRDHNPIDWAVYDDILNFEEGVVIKPTYDEVYEAHFGDEYEEGESPEDESGAG